MEIVPQAAKTKIHAPLIRYWVLQQPVVQLARIPLSSRAFREIPAAHPAAIALTTTTVHRCAPITSSRQVKSAMAIVPQHAMMALTAQPILLAEVQRVAMPLVVSLISPLAQTPMGAARVDVTIITMVIAHRAVGIA